MKTNGFLDYGRRRRLVGQEPLLLGGCLCPPRDPDLHGRVGAEQCGLPLLRSGNLQALWATMHRFTGVLSFHWLAEFNLSLGITLYRIS